jgi:hypothetical protein
MSVKYLLADDRMYDDIKSAYGGLFRGIYRLHVLDERGEFLPLSRLLDNDVLGIIYIGTSKEVPNRVGSLRKSVSAAYRKIASKTYAHLPYMTEGPHQAGRKIMRIPRFVEHFPFERLCVTVEKYAGSQVETADYGYYDLETKLLELYEKQYGERPALNG